ncbi:MAG TPA: alpha/beta hydrolase, partial [Myxococcota bacterium]|nr:alpha/beta hydrolase [Myxococcota bacterium]
MALPPPAPPFPTAQRISLPRRTGQAGGGIELSVHHAGRGPAVVLCHGFPELAFSWRHQLPAFAAAGFRVVAPDQRGYGASDRPAEISAYDIHHLTGDLVALLDALGIEKAVFAGHDWGGLVVWQMPLLHPERTAGVVGVNTPFFPRGPVAPTQIMRALVGGQDEKMYILWFQQPGVAEAVMNARVRLVFERLMRSAISVEELTARTLATGGDMNPFRHLEELPEFGDPILRPDELDHYVRTFERTGFGGGIHWYRNIDRNWETTAPIAGAKVTVPALMVTAEWDPVLR